MKQLALRNYAPSDFEQTSCPKTLFIHTLYPLNQIMGKTQKQVYNMIVRRNLQDMLTFKMDKTVCPCEAFPEMPSVCAFRSLCSK